MMHTNAKSRRHSHLLVEVNYVQGVHHLLLVLVLLVHLLHDVVDGHLALAARLLGGHGHVVGLVHGVLVLLALLIHIILLLIAILHYFMHLNFVAYRRG